MKLAEDKFFGPQKITKLMTEYPPYQVKVDAVMYGYETKDTIYDVVFLKRPVWVPQIKSYISKYYAKNGNASMIPDKVHIAVEKHFDLE
jgi:hypothetical protein